MNLAGERGLAIADVNGVGFAITDNSLPRARRGERRPAYRRNGPARPQASGCFAGV
jgi:hypothetical protein